MKASDYETYDSQKLTTKQIRKLLLNMGFPPHIYGYDYILYALELIAIDPGVLHHITKELYPDIAMYFGTTPSKVEHNIRNTTHKVWLHGNVLLINQIFGNTVNTGKGIPSNSHLLAGLYQYLMDEQEQIQSA
jgi:two-component system response regulator (stage 0 sporulation protein A)